MTLLDAVNIVLRAVGEGRILDISSTHPSVEPAKAVITEAQDLVLAAGYWFNTDFDVALPKDIDDEIPLPENTISVRALQPYQYLTFREGRLYDPVNNTFKFPNVTSIRVNYTSNPDFDDIPPLAQQAIAYAAAAMFVGDDDGDDVKYRRAKSRADTSAVRLNAEDIKQKRLNALNSPTSFRVRSGVSGATNRIRSGDYIGG